MKVSEVVKAWRDPMFRSTRSNVPASPAGMVELSGTALDAVAGGTGTTGGSSKKSHRSSKSHGSSKKRHSSKRRRSSKKC